jgi:solute carrier family 45, member 1/2/4
MMASSVQDAATGHAVTDACRPSSSPPPPARDPLLCPALLSQGSPRALAQSPPIAHHTSPRSSALLPSPFPDCDGNEDVVDEFAMPRRSTLYMIYLTLIMAGIQVAWSAEFAYISPYLLSLGLPKSTLSLIWVAGPVSGVIVQPLIGMLSDRSKFKWGRRRVFMVTSTVAVVLAFVGMGRTREIVRWWTGQRDWESVRTAVIVLAVTSLILLDLAINASIPTHRTSSVVIVATAAARALIVDSVPTEQQNTANAWAGRMLGVGNVLGYLRSLSSLDEFL